MKARGYFRGSLDAPWAASTELESFAVPLPVIRQGRAGHSRTEMTLPMTLVVSASRFVRRKNVPAEVSLELFEVD